MRYAGLDLAAAPNPAFAIAMYSDGVELGIFKLKFCISEKA
jgi:hypothetical protein